MNPTLHYAGCSDPGRIRRGNEDRWMAAPDRGLFIVADGMGGTANGELAAQIVVSVLPGLLHSYLGRRTSLIGTPARQGMKQAIATLSTELRQRTEKEPALAGMGSTVVCALVRGQEVLLAHLGDSRAYRLRAGRLKQLTKDHSTIQRLLDAAVLTPVQARYHPARGRLTRGVGMSGSPQAQTRLLQVKPGDLLLLCTDGLTGMLDDAGIRSILAESASLETKCRKLMEAANQAGGVDNITALLLAWSDAGAFTNRHRPGTSAVTCTPGTTSR